MCHPEVPAGQQTPTVTREEVQLPLATGEHMPALLARPDGNPEGAVLIINDIFGRSPFYEDLAARLAAAGFTALCPEFFFRQGPLAVRSFEAAISRGGQLDRRQMLDDLNAALAWLKQEQGARRLGTVGFCLGGTTVFNLAAERDDLASVSFYGFPVDRNRRAGAASVPAPIDQVAQLHGPILAFWGDQDAGVGMDNVQRYVQAIQARGDAVDFAYTVYPGLGHGFMSASRLDPNHEAFAMACEAWTRTLDFYRQHLGAPALASA